MGDPWDGQVRAKEESRYSFVTVNLSFLDTLGAALPIGSEIDLFLAMLHSQYLNAGMGDPWDGQVKATEEAITSLVALILSFLDTLGAALPIGSEKVCSLLCLHSNT